MAKVLELGLKLLPHPLYSPDLTPSDFFLFSSHEEIMAAVDKDFKGFETSYFSEETKKLEER